MDHSVKSLDFARGRKTPLVLQSEKSECGLACMAMIMGHYGAMQGLRTLRSKYPRYLVGMSIKDLVDLSQEMGANGRALNAPSSLLNKLVLPTILHWEDNHFVVLTAIGKNQYRILDPAIGERTLSKDEFDRYYTGSCVEIIPGTEFIAEETGESIKLSDLWGSIQGFWPALTQVLILSVILQVYILIAPQFMQQVIDVVLPSFNVDLLLTLAIGFGILLAINTGATIIRGLCILYFGASLSYQVAISVFRYMMRLPLQYFGKRHVGDIASRFGSIIPIQKFLSNSVATGSIDGVMATLTLGLMLYYSLALAGISLVFFSVFFGIRIAFLGRYRALTQSEISAAALDETNFLENLKGMQTIRAFSVENDRIGRWQNLRADSTNRYVDRERFELYFQAMSYLFNGVEYILLVYFAASAVLVGDLTVGMIFAFFAYREQFVSKSGSLIETFVEWRMLKLHLERISDIVLEPALVQPKDRVQITEGSVEVQNLSFSYSEAFTPAVENLSHKFESGSITAITGPSGKGKTTLVKLLLGLISPSSGAIFIDGKDLSKVDQAHYRQQVGTVLQDDVLLSGTLLENISMFSKNVDWEKLEEVATAACIHDFIEGLPLGYHTPIGDLGSEFSGGQSQRIFLARALYRSPKILFMDEGTAHLDPDLEVKVGVNIKALGITRIIVAHRVETIRQADSILRL